MRVPPVADKPHLEKYYGVWGVCYKKEMVNFEWVTRAMNWISSKNQEASLPVRKSDFRYNPDRHGPIV
jgi:hypothetical protein